MQFSVYNCQLLVHSNDLVWAIFVCVYKHFNKFDFFSDTTKHILSKFGLMHRYDKGINVPLISSPLTLKPSAFILQRNWNPRWLSWQQFGNYISNSTDLILLRLCVNDSSVSWCPVCGILGLTRDSKWPRTMQCLL